MISFPKSSAFRTSARHSGEVERIRGGEQKNCLTTRIRFPQGIFPTFACTDVLHVEENVPLRPAIGTKPLFECNGCNVVLARVAYEEP